MATILLHGAAGSWTTWRPLIAALAAEAGGPVPDLVVPDLPGEWQRVVDTYADEWKNAVEDPAVRQRFRSFVNSENTDDNVVFMPERGQIRPATPDERRRVIPIAAA